MQNSHYNIMLVLYNIKFYFLFFYYFIVVQLPLSHLFPQCSPLPAPQLPQSIPPIVRAREPSNPVPLLAPSFSFPVTSLPPPLWSLSVCSLFPSLWFYFAHLFVLLIRFHL